MTPPFLFAIIRGSSNHIMSNFEFGPYSKFKPEKPKPKNNYKYPYMDILESGQDHGFFVWGLKKKLTIPSSIKNTKYEIRDAVHPETKERGYYIYVHHFSNGEQERRKEEKNLW